MDEYKDMVEQLVYSLESELKKYTREYDSIPKGTLIQCKNSGKSRYYQSWKEDGRYFRKSIDKDKERIRMLARREYLGKHIETLTRNLRILRNADSALRPDDFDTLKAQMHKAYRELPDEYFFRSKSDMEAVLTMGRPEFEEGIRRHQEWAKEPYKKSSYRPDRLKYMTSAGFRVRSKSEQHIVEQLVNYGVPFRYEQVIEIDGRDYSADFTFRDRNMELFYWEHAGMMDLPEYVDGYYRKMNAYDTIGIVPWKNLIVTYDIDGVINVPMIKSIIEHEVLERL